MAKQGSEGSDLRRSGCTDDKGLDYWRGFLRGSMEAFLKITKWKLSFIGKWWPILIFAWCVFWFIFIFTPVEQGDAFVRATSQTKFLYSNVSRKPFPSNLICRITDSVTVVDSNTGTDYQRNHRQDNWGSGSRDWKTWRVTGLIPFGATTAVVYKELTYICFEFLHKKVYTTKRILDLNLPLE